VIGALIASGTLAGVLAASCGGDASPAAVVTPVEGSGAITVVAEDTSFSVGRIEVQAGTTTTVRFENRDTVAHTLTVYVAASPDGPIAADTGEVAPGETGEAVVLFSAPGEYAFRCEIHPDQMRGTIVVR